MEKFLCPKCKKFLKNTGKSLVCVDAHSYDIAKEGYVNLLLSNMKKSKEPGDNAEMSRARFQFLAGGTYAPLAEQISALVAEYAASAPCILDAGSGSGYYDKVLSETIKDAKIYGVDLSKEAVKLAAKHNKTAFYAVASVYDLPFSDEAFDVILCIFSPHAFSEYRRVLKRGGVLIVAYPDREHLFELKKLLYGDATYENEKQLYTEEFSLSKSCRIKFSADISCGALKTLLRMTPYYYTTEKTALLRVENIYGLSITFDFKIDVFIRE